MTCNILDFGAIPGGKVLNTKAIQTAIDTCTQTGGRVVVPTGVFLTGTLELKSNVELHLEMGARLVLSDNLDDLNPDDAYEMNYMSTNEGWNKKHFIYCVEQENVAITGLGIIDSNADAFFDPMYPDDVGGYEWRNGRAREKDKVNLRPGQSIVFQECKNIKVENVSLLNATCWALFLIGCEYVQVHGVKIKNRYYHLNTDGIDVDTSKYVNISDCIIETGDDGITFRGCNHHLSEKMRETEPACEYVTVSNCVISSSASSFRIGVGKAPIRHIQVSNIVIPYSGMVFSFSAEWANSSRTPIHDVSFSNISAFDTGKICHIGIEYHTKLSNIYFSNITAETMSGAYFCSSDLGDVSNIRLRDIYIKAVEDTVKVSKESKRAFLHFENIDNLFLDNIQVEISDELAEKQKDVLVFKGNVGSDKENIKFINK